MWRQSGLLDGERYFHGTRKGVGRRTTVITESPLRAFCPFRACRDPEVPLTPQDGVRGTMSRRTQFFLTTGRYTYCLPPGGGVHAPIQSRTECTAEVTPWVAVTTSV